MTTEENLSTVDAAPAASVISALTTLAEVPTYVEAQAVVDRLSDGGFAVEHVRIIGVGLNSVEQVTGRLTTAKSALYGAGTGAWIGLLIGLFIGIFVEDSSWVAVVLGGVLFGAVWGAVFGFVAHYATGGTRDFRSISGVQASRYVVQVDADYLADARRLIATP